MQGDETGRPVWPRRAEIRVEDMVQDAFARADAIHADIIDNNNVVHEDTPNPEEALPVDADAMDEMISESTQPVWDGCGINRLQAGIILMNMCNLHGVPNTFLDELLTFLSSDLLPRGNNLTRTTYETKRMVMKMGLEHVPIHCCPAGHVLYEGEENKDLEECPKCSQPRYVPGSNKVPVKVLRYFPIIPRLQRLFRCREVAKLLKYHSANQSEDGMVRSVLHSEQCASVAEIDPRFPQKDTNLYLGLVADGVNPFGNQNLRHSTWPLLTVMYNLPPWLVARRFFISLTMIIPGERALELWELALS